MHQLKDRHCQTKKRDSNIYSIHKIHFKYKDSDRLKLRGWENIHHANTNQKKARVAILIANKADLRTRKIARDSGTT